MLLMSLMYLTLKIQQLYMSELHSAWYRSD